MDIAGFNEQSQSTAWCERGWRHCSSQLTVKSELKIPLFFRKHHQGPALNPLKAVGALLLVSVRTGTPSCVYSLQSTKLYLNPFPQ